MLNKKIIKLLINVLQAEEDEQIVKEIRLTDLKEMDVDENLVKRQNQGSLT